MEAQEIKKRTDYAVQLFEQGYNCSQSVFMAYADKFGVDKTLAASLSTSFGGGIGRLREMCGAVSGGAMLLGLKYPHLDPSDATPKNSNYLIVQNFALEFKKEIGSYNCDDILDIFSALPEINTEQAAFSIVNPCVKCVKVAAELVAAKL